MFAELKPLATVPLPRTTDLVRPDQRPTPRIGPDSPALSVMTDLRVITPVSIGEDADLKSALQLMVSRGIRLLFVQDAEGQLAGLVTAVDLQGERPIQCMKEHGKHHADLTVGDIMTPRKVLDALELTTIEHATVGHLVSTMKALGRQHALVVEVNRDTGHHELCGLISTTHMARLLGTPLSFIRIPRALSEIQYSLLYG